MFTNAHQKIGYFNPIEAKEAVRFKAPAAFYSDEALHNYVGWWWWTIQSTVGGFV